jgi:hypothetical protein
VGLLGYLIASAYWTWVVGDLARNLCCARHCYCVTKLSTNSPGQSRLLFQP